MGDVVPFRKGCHWNDGGACLAKHPHACACERERRAPGVPRLITAINTITNPHSPMHTSPLMQPGRDAGSIGWTPELRALEHAEMIRPSAPAKPIDDVIRELPS